jgi:hypothetical protein
VRHLPGFALSPYPHHQRTKQERFFHDLTHRSAGPATEQIQDERHIQIALADENMGKPASDSAPLTCRSKRFGVMKCYGRIPLSAVHWPVPALGVGTQPISGH